MPKTSKKSEGSCTEAAPHLKEKSLWSTGKKTSVIIVGMIAIIAFVIRAAFSFGTSTDNMFALSGGLEASEHLHTVVQILKGNNVFGPVSSLCYPCGSINGNPIVIDFIIAGIAAGVMNAGVPPIVAASLALGTFAVLCGTITVVIAYILGMEVVGTRKAGYFTAIFMAFCPVVISQTVFSNGAEVGWHLLLITIFFTLFIKGIKSFNILPKEDKLDNVVKNNHRSMKYGLISGAILALITISTSNFRPVVVTLIFVMVAVVIVDRLRNIDSRLPILYFSIIILIGMIVATAYYIPASLWNNVLSGIFIATMFAIAICVAFSMLQTMPCAITIPVFTIITLAFFIGLAVITPNLFNSVVYGNSGYAPEVSKLVASKMSISRMSTFFGPVALWFSLAMVISMLINIRKNIGSHKYITVFMIIFFGTYYGWKSQSYATMFSFVFAIGFSYVMTWLFNSIDFKSYFASFKTANFKTFWKKLIKPAPFVSILSTIFLLIAPNVVYAVDASISVNQNNDLYGPDPGLVGYDITDVNNALLTYQHSDKNGAMVCWSSNSNDASTFGGFDVITDSKGNGAVAVSNIFLSNGINGSSTAAMLIYTLKQTGFDDDIKDKLNKAGLEEEDYCKLMRIVNNPCEFRSDVIGKDDFSTVSKSVSDENISYLYGKWFLTKKYDGFTISKMYDALRDRCKISHFMIDGSIFPMYYWRSSAFNDMVISNGYTVADNKTTREFTDGRTVTNTGIVYYSYTDKMYNTFLWRSYIGMSPKEAEIDDTLDYLTKLTLSDGKYKAQPGYGLSNYVAELDHWFVMYNPDKSATASSDGWTKMLYADAISKQEKEGGLINYLSGLPVFLKYIPNSDGITVSGTVSCTVNCRDSGVKGVRVSAIDPDGMVRSTTYTDNNGKFNLNVTNQKSTINFYTGSNNLSDGMPIKTVKIGDKYDANIPQTSVNGNCVDKDGKDVGLEVKVVMKGKTTGTEGKYEGSSNEISIKNIVPDVYDVKITSLDEKTTYVAKTHMIIPGDNKGVEFKINEDVESKTKTCKVTLTFKDEFGLKSLSGKKAKLIDTANVSYTSEIDDDGMAVYNVPNGTYKIEFDEDYISITQELIVNDVDNVKNTGISKTITAMSSKTVNFNGFSPNSEIKIYSSGYQTSGTADIDGSLSIKLPRGISDKVIYSAYSLNKEKVDIAKSDDGKAAGHNAIKISGELKTSSGTTTAGTILFIRDGIQIPVHSPDGKYDVSLGEGEYTVYAYADKGSDAVIDSYIVSNSEKHDIKLEQGKLIEVKVSCQPVDLKMCYVPFNVNIKDHNLNFVTDMTGSYKFYIPDKEKCKIKIYESDNYHVVDANGVKVTDKDEIEVTDKADLKVHLCDINVQNNANYPIEIGGMKIENKSNANIKITSNAQHIKIDHTDANHHYYYEGRMHITPTTKDPTTKKIIINNNTFDVVEYYPLKIVNANNYKVNIDPMDSGRKIDASNGTYYLEHDKKFRVTAINNDSKKVLYKNISKAETINIDNTSKPMFTLTGFVGLAGSGKITATIGDEKLDFDVDESGRYKIFVPTCESLELSASIKNKDKQLYTASDSINCLNWSGEKVYNLAVTRENKATGKTDEIEIDSKIDKMSINGDVAEIIFSLQLSKGNTKNKTYTISGGSDWYHVSFYSDKQMTHQISSVNDSTTIYGKGTISLKVGLGSNNLSITLKDLNDKVCGTEVLDDPNNKWYKIDKTDCKSIEIHAGINSIGDSYATYALEIVNKDNYVKKFKIDHERIEEYWHKTYIYNEKETNELNNINVPGYNTATVSLKLTSKYGPHEFPKSIKFTINAIDGAIDTPESFESKIASNFIIDITDSSADGRYVVNNMRSMPVAIWVLIVMIIILLFITIWEAFRRGVFTRRK
ncbi:MAG: hypothetical protein MJZ03_02745 [archaeon]|nr:hypothetical protein [archaeon]